MSSAGIFEKQTEGFILEGESSKKPGPIFNKLLTEKWRQRIARRPIPFAAVTEVNFSRKSGTNVASGKIVYITILSFKFGSDAILGAQWNHQHTTTLIAHMDATLS